LKDHLQREQNQQKVHAYKHMVELTFEVNELVYLRFQLYRQASIKTSGTNKIQPHFFGPYIVNMRVGDLAYEFDLLQGNKIHNVFHVLFLKRAINKHSNHMEKFPPMDEERQLVLILEEILEVREKKLRKISIREYLVKWKNLLMEDATWEGEQLIHKIGPKFLVGKQFLEGETVISPSS
jgi:hypothetical protein